MRRTQQHTFLSLACISHAAAAFARLENRKPELVGLCGTWVIGGYYMLAQDDSAT